MAFDRHEDMVQLAFQVHMYYPFGCRQDVLGRVTYVLPMVAMSRFMMFSTESHQLRRVLIGLDEILEYASFVWIIQNHVLWFSLVVT